VKNNDGIHVTFGEIGEFGENGENGENGNQGRYYHSTTVTERGGNAPNPSLVFHRGMGGGIGKMRGFHKAKFRVKGETLFDKEAGMLDRWGRFLESGCRARRRREKAVRNKGVVVGIRCPIKFIASEETGTAEWHS
jgi:hypothetical protein